METSPQRFEDRDPAAAWLARTFESWRRSLSEDERTALSAYKQDAYEFLNEALRLETALSDEDEDIVSGLDAALSRFRLPESVITWRGYESEQLRQVPEGFEIVDLGYASTSLLRIVAVEFTQGSGSLAEILIPGGASIGSFAAAPDLIRPGGELEILLPRETRFRILRQAHTIEMEVIVP